MGLAGGEPEVGGSQLDELAAGAKPRQRQRRVGPGGQDDPEPLGQVLDEERDRLVHLGLGDDVVVVEDQHTGVGVGGEVVDQAGDRVEGRGGGVGRGARLQPGPLQGGHEVGEEPGDVVVALVEREPGDTDVGASLGEAADPLGEDGRLAEPRRRGDQPQPVSGRQELVQPVRQPLARHGLRPAGRDEELGGQHRSRHGPSIGTARPVGARAAGRAASDAGRPRPTQVGVLLSSWSRAPGLRARSTVPGRPSERSREVRRRAHVASRERAHAAARRSCLSPVRAGW